MHTNVLRLVSCLTVIGLAACAPGGQPATTSAAAPAATDQSAPAPAVASTTTGKLACLDNPNYATMPPPPSGRRGRAAQWLAKPDGSGCHWTRNAG